ncbi:sulfite reductase subunit alpha [Shumkonia mesophila]|uniref:sulfite reductase subunit alpha n=1 Tax=Shumkonia mesophila TaxID=2838854 RepID=UPI002934C1C1|nr:sulfite reductase subunit alpha [Shumkonia mesophila]
MTTQTATRPWQIVPPTAPFSDDERERLNAFFLNFWPNKPGAAGLPAPVGANEEDELPWKDPAMPLADRMARADGRPLKQRLMAAMGQQDCGQCGYDCSRYAAAIFEQAEPRLQLCVPGGKETSRMLKSLVEEMGGGVLDPDEMAAKAAAAPKLPADERPGRSRARPVEAHFVGCRRLNGEGSEKTTLHVELDLEGSGLDYRVGDSLGILPRNDPALADQVIAAINVPPDFPIAGRPFRDVLIEETSLGTAPDALFQLVSYITGGERRMKAKALAKGEDPDGDAASLDVLGVLQKFEGIRPDPEALMEVLDPLQPRLYSISSSPKVHPGRVHLTVDVVRYEAAGRLRLGVASTFLADRVQPGEALKVYVQEAHGFALPADPATPIVMVGPGTGVAPFRAFLQERDALGAPGPAWLFFGHQREASDFFYAEEFRHLQERGALTNLSLAWSRDGTEKVYVQHRMRERGAELFEWLQAGAHVYVCGDALRMAKDVETALTDIVAEHGKRPPDAARAYVQDLKKRARYQADVY